VANGARLALAEAGGRVGELRIEAVYLDDTGGGSRWSPVASAANARRAAEDSSTIGYIGELDSGATRFSLPITNQAGIAQVSPGATAVDLTRFVNDELEPDRYRPGEEQTFLRLVPDEEDEQRAATRLADELGGAKQVSTAAELFAPGSSEAPMIGPYPLFNRFTRICRRLDGTLYVTSPFREPFRLGQRGRPFRRAYAQRFGQPLPPAAYGYEAMALLLDSIEKEGDAGDSRDAVIDRLLSTTDRESVIGDYSIDANGDTTLEVITVHSIRNCHRRFGRELDVSS
jgi:ABC-type branched-subunit amino acid transport system substrate-binding protein